MLNHAIFKRVPVVGTDRRIMGNTLSAPEAGSELVLNALSLAVDLWPVRDHLVFIAADLDVLNHALIGSLPARNIVFKVKAPFDEPMVARIRALRAEGFQFAAEVDATTCKHPDVAALAAFVVFDLAQMDEKALIEAAARCGRPYGQMLAVGVDSHALFATARKAHIARLEGNWFDLPMQLAGRPIVPAHAIVVELLDRVRKEAKDEDLEEVFKRDATLTFKLLRHINSAGFGLSCEIESIWHAIRVLGRRELYRWLTLLLVTADETTPQVLTRTAVVRGRFCELLGQQLLDRKELDSLFIVGVFSLLDAMLEMPMEQVLENIILSDTVNEALLNNEGLHAPFLELVKACESPQEHHRAEELAMSLGLTAVQINHAHLAALAWADALGV